VEESLHEIYYDPASTGGFGGVERLLAESKRRGLQVSRKRVEDFLADQEAYARHKPVRRNFPRNPTYVHGIDDQWQADLAEVQHLAKENDGIRYLLTCIDVFSKHAWVVAVRSKSKEDMVEAFNRLFRTSKRLPHRLQTDKGKEFLCKPVQQLLKQRGVRHFTSNSDKKAAVVERFNRTLKMRMFRYLTAENTKRYIDVLQRLVDSYNKSHHRSIGMAPADVRKQHERHIWYRLYGAADKLLHRRRRLGPGKEEPEAGEVVRISRWKGTFEKGYAPNWSDELFNVHRAVKHPLPMFELRDAKDEPIEGRFYAKELQRVRRGEYVVEKVLAERRRQDGVREVLVKWEGWPPSYNSWVEKATLRDMQ
jgi:transposase InsO family protein